MTQSADQALDDKRYSVIPRTLIFLFDQWNRVLLIKGSPHKKLWPGLYNGIGGHMECGEDALEAAQRELAEETGLTGVALELCGQIMIHVTEKAGVALFIFKGGYSGEIMGPSEEGELAWIELSQLEKIPLVEDLQILLPKVAAHHTGDQIIIGKYRYTHENKLDISIR